MATSYFKIYDRFLNKVKDYFITELSDSELSEYCHNLMMAALAKLENIDHDLSRYDDLTAEFTEDLSNKEIEYVACMMACEWVEPQLNNTTITTQYIGAKDEKFFSPSNLIDQLRGLRDDWYTRAKKIRRDYNYSNSEYFSG